MQPTRTLYIQNIDVYEHYMHVKHCRRIVDARVVQRALVAMARLAFFADMVRWAEMTNNGSLYGWLFEALIHKLASDHVLELTLKCYQAWVPLSSEFIVLAVDVDSQLIIIDSTCSVVSYGVKKHKCLEYLQYNLTDNMYWSPDYALFPSIDAILVQGRCVYYLQMTVTPTHTMNWNTIKLVHKAVNANKHLVGFKHSYVFLTPPPPRTTWTRTNMSGIEGLNMCYASARQVPGAQTLVSLL